jgi:hypothetical protein
LEFNPNSSSRPVPVGQTSSDVPAVARTNIREGAQVRIADFNERVDLVAGLSPKEMYATAHTRHREKIATARGQPKFSAGTNSL